MLGCLLKSPDDGSNMERALRIPNFLGSVFCPRVEDMRCIPLSRVSHETAEELIQAQLKQLVLDAFAALMLDRRQRVLDD